MTKILTIDQSFQKFLSNLNPTDKQLQRIQKTRESIDAVLVNDPRITLNAQKQISFLTGSYSRKTIIRPIDDIDLYVRIHSV
jgi:tRNA nucleotidyltransferase (CCA-adding enzyme)